MNRPGKVGFRVRGGKKAAAKVCMRPSLCRSGFSADANAMIRMTSRRKSLSPRPRSAVVPRPRTRTGRSPLPSPRNPERARQPSSLTRKRRSCPTSQSPRRPVVVRRGRLRRRRRPRRLRRRRSRVRMRLSLLRRSPSVVGRRSLLELFRLWLFCLLCEWCLRGL